MEFGLSSAQALLQESVGRCLEDSASLERVKSFVNGDQRRAEDVWTALCDMAVPGLLIAEEHGGIGLGLLDAALVADTLGAHVAPAPFVATSVMAPIAIASAGSEMQQSRWLPELAKGHVIAGVAVTEAVGSRLDARIRRDGRALNGKALFVLDFEADLYLVADENRTLYLVEASAPGVERRRLTTIDKTRRVGELVLDNVAAEPLPGSSDPEVCARVISLRDAALASSTTQEDYRLGSQETRNRT